MLPYENQMFLDVLHEDGLLVAARGLGLEHVLYSLIKVYSDPGNLVLVMGTTDAEEEHFARRLAEDREDPAADKSIVPPKKITTDYSTTERQGVYLQVVHRRVNDLADSTHDLTALKLVSKENTLKPPRRNP